MSNGNEIGKARRYVYVHPCSQQHYSQKPKVEVTPNPFIDEWLNQMWYIYIKEYNIIWFEKEENSVICYTWINLEGIILSEINQSQRTNTILFDLYEDYRVIKFIEKVKW